MNTLLRPAEWLMGRLDYRQKFLLMGFMFLCACAVLLHALFFDLSRTQAHLQSELQGNALVAEVSRSVRLVQQHRGLSAAVAGGHKAMEPLLEGKDREADASLRQLFPVLSSMPQVQYEAAGIEADWRRILEAGRGWSVEENFVRHNRLIESMLNLQERIADTSGLILDTEVNTHYLVDITVTHLPALLERLGKIRAYGTGILADRKVSEERKFELLYLIADFQSSLKTLQQQLLRVREYSPAYDLRLMRSGEAIHRASIQFTQLATEQTLDRVFSMAPEAFFQNLTTSMDVIYGELFDTFHATFAQLIEERLARVQRQVAITVLAAAFLLGLFLYLAAGAYRAVMGSIRSLVNSLGQFAKGDFDQRVKLHTGDEMREIGEKFNDMAAEISELLRNRQEALAEQVHANSQLAMAARVFHESHEGISISDVNGIIQSVNPAFCSITGYSEAEVVGQSHRILQSGRQSAAFYADLWHTLLQQGTWQGEIWNRRKGGAEYAEMLTISALRDESGVVNQYVALFSDITEVKTYRDHLERQAHYDELTGLPNRVLLSDRLQHALAGAHRNGSLMAVAALDLDGFKSINDTYGHEAGDKVLVETGKRIQATLRSNDTVARVGGDEFVLILTEVNSDADCIRTLDRVLGHISKAIGVGQGKYGTVTGSIGYTLFPEDDTQNDGLLRHADMAMYASKQGGKNQVTHFDVNLDHRQRGYSETLKRLEKGLQKSEFCLYVQPKVDLRTGAVVGAEALMRWMHPIRGLIGPTEFLPLLADKKDLSLAFDDWVLAEGVRVLVAWQAEGLDLPLSLNMSPFQFQRMDFAERITQVIAAQPGLRTNQLEIEILESSALEDLPHAVELIAKCQAIGVRFALDDFGTGYSTLTYLKQMAVDTLKIDRSFVHDMQEDASSIAIVKGIVGMAEAFNCGLVAEGVESWKQARTLLHMGCFIIQGYAAAKPMPANELPQWVAAFSLPDLNGEDLQ
jgi:diguanylate cyclase (GGDEF)-like protein/PAS domain S-box-containing protein